MTLFQKGSNEEWFRQIAENISEVFFIVDAKKKEMMYASPAHERVFGLKPEILYANPKAWIEQIIPEDRGKMYQAFENAEKQIAAEYTFRVQHPDGSIHQILSKVFPVKNAAGDVYRVVGIAEDVTEKKRVEELRREAEIIKARQDFLFQTVHDLRAPTNIIRMIMEDYNEIKDFSKLPEVMKESADMVRNANARMARLIQDLFEIAQGAKVVFKKDRIDIVGALQRVLKEFGPVLQKRAVKVEYAPGTVPPVLGDAEKLTEVFSNLVDNAIKYNKEGGSLTISHEPEGKFLKTKVADTGIGIADADIPKLFTPYFRTGQDPKAVGTGLGLYIVKNLTEQMDGKIEVFSALGEGTAFTVFLPLAHS